MTKTKRDLLTNVIIERCETLTSVRITNKQKNMLHDFIVKRLHLHGRNGYMFHVSDNYFTREYLVTDDDLSIQRIAFYVLENNHIKVF